MKIKLASTVTVTRPVPDAFGPDALDELGGILDAAVFDWISGRADEWGFHFDIDVIPERSRKS